jgi:hypothetical protein
MAYKSLIPMISPDIHIKTYELGKLSWDLAAHTIISNTYTSWHVNHHLPKTACSHSSLSTGPTNLMIPQSRPVFPLPSPIHRGPTSRPAYVRAHTGASAQTYTSSSYSPAGTPIDELPIHEFTANMPDRSQDRGQTGALRDPYERDDEDLRVEDFRGMHLTAEDHAGDPSSRYDLMDLLGTGNFGKVYKA